MTATRAALVQVLVSLEYAPYTICKAYVSILTDDQCTTSLYWHTHALQGIAAIE